MVRNELIKKLGDKFNNLSGAKIFTILNLVSQQAAENSIKQGIINLRKRHKLFDLESAMVVIDRINSEVCAIVGGFQLQYFDFNHALNVHRSIDSLVKPSIYLTALTEPNRFKLNTLVLDKLISMKFNNKIWKPKNYDRNFRGKVILIDALINLLNITTVNIGLDIGLDHISKILISLEIPSTTIEKVPLILLSALNLTLIETVPMFQTISCGGNKTLLLSLRFVINSNGNKLYQSYPSSKLIMPP
ncbi:MAG: hypothetical protein ArsCj_3650 [Arsenophonus endosymbiont of Ceratovacuna japonica]